MKERNITIDILKVIGLMMIILAHVCTSNIIFQIRNFDVPLMVLISGFLAVDSYKKNQSLWKYFAKRFIRLYLPTFCFLLFFFGICLFFLFFREYPFSFEQIVKSFLLIDGIGYVWIIRVYLLCAVAVPILIFLNKSLETKKMCLLLLAIYLCYEFFVYFDIYQWNPLFNHIISYFIPYSVILAIGMIIRDLSSKKLYFYSIMFLLIYLILAVSLWTFYGSYQLTSIMKYPPRLYYISYALALSFFLFAFFKQKSIHNPKILKGIQFISGSSLWIYLWHILFIYIFKFWSIPIPWIYQYVIVVIGACLIIFVQNKFVHYLEKKNVHSIFLQILKG